MTSDWRDDRIGAAHRGENPLVMARLPAGFAVIGDTQFLPGYSVLLTDDRSVNHLTDLAWTDRLQYLSDLALLGEAIERACESEELHRINYEVLGNSSPFLHAHVHPRYTWEPPERIKGPVWRYPKEIRADPANDYRDDRHGKLRGAITEELNSLINSRY